MLMIFFIVLVLFLAYGVFCLVAAEKHLALNSWWNRQGRKEWHEDRAYTPLHLRLQRRWSQKTPANLWGIRITGIWFIGMSLWAIWWYYLRIHH